VRAILEKVAVALIVGTFTAAIGIYVDVQKLKMLEEQHQHQLDVMRAELTDLWVQSNNIAQGRQ